MSEIRLFVSYTHRGGHITKKLLSSLRSELGRIGIAFIHESCREGSKESLVGQQLRIIVALLRCDIMILLESPLVYRSPWVRFELALARLAFRPILILDASKLAAAKLAALPNS